MASYFSYFIDYNYSVNIYLWYLQTSPGERWMWRYQPKDTSTSIFHKILHKQLIGKKEANKDGYDGNCNQHTTSRFTFLLPKNGANFQVCSWSLIYYLLFDYFVHTYIQQSNMICKFTFQVSCDQPHEHLLHLQEYPRTVATNISITNSCSWKSTKVMYALFELNHYKASNSISNLICI